MTDIIERLLNRATHAMIIKDKPNLYYDAVYEIERLRKDNQKLRDALTFIQCKAHDTLRPIPFQEDEDENS